MQKRKNRFIFSIGISQIFLVLMSVFAFAFLFSQLGIVSAQEAAPSSGGVSFGIRDWFSRVFSGRAPQAKSVEITGQIVGKEAPANLVGPSGSASKILGLGGKEALQVDIPSKFLSGGGNPVSGTITQVATRGTDTFAVVDGQYHLLNEEGVAGLKGFIAQQGLAAESVSEINIGITKIPLGTGYGYNFVAHLAEGVIWGGVVALIIKLIGPSLGLDQKQADAAALAAFGGIVTGKFTYGLFTQNFVYNHPILSYGGGLVVGGLVAFAIFAATYKKEKKKLVSFQCLPFEPPIGGAKCEECNKDLFRPCSEYRCRALGQACQLLNPGTNEERCTWVNPKDVNSPIISAWGDALKPKGLSYVPDNAIRPPNRGVKIVRGSGGCIQAFTPLEFGVILNEPAQCKIDYNPNKTFDNMEFYFGGSNYYRYNHTQKMKLPAPDSGNVGESGGLAPELKNDGFFSLFTQCRDANGNVNVDKFVFNFCVDKSPDTTPPVIEGTSIKSGGFVRFDASNVPIEVYTNEPAECKWSRDSRDYKDMENTMNCGTETYQINADLNYVCSSNLTGIRNQQDNKFYFRCKDQPDKPESERNVNTQSYELVLRGSQPLSILSVEPNGTIFGSTDTIPVDLSVRTDDGAEEGKAICYFSTTGLPDSYIAMFETNSFEHRQKLDLRDGSYKYFFRCIDFGGNSADSESSFSVEIDKEIPVVTRAYKDDGLKVVTNEDAQCVYDLKSCNYEFKEGLPMIYSNPSMKRNHFAEWKANSVYYIKCSDFYDNGPGPNECSIVVNSVELAREG